MRTRILRNDANQAKPGFKFCRRMRTQLNLDPDSTKQCGPGWTWIWQQGVCHHCMHWRKSFSFAHLDPHQQRVNPNLILASSGPHRWSLIYKTKRLFGSFTSDRSTKRWLASGQDSTLLHTEKMQEFNPPPRRGGEGERQLASCQPEGPGLTPCRLAHWQVLENGP